MAESTAETTNPDTPRRTSLVGRSTPVPVDPVTHLLDDARSEAGRTARQDRAVQHEVARTLADWLGLLAASARSGSPVVLETTDGGIHHGSVAATGTDVVVVERSDGLVLLPSDRIRSLRATLPGPVADGRAQSEPTAICLRDLLAERAEWRAPVVLRLQGGGSPVQGTLWSCGEDVCSVRTGQGPTAVHVHVPIRAISEAVVPRG